MAGKHESPPAHGLGSVLGGVVIVVLLGSGVAWAVMSTQTETHGSTTTPSAPRRPAEQPVAKATTSLAACATGVAAREQLARAAAASARDWTTHTGAELKLDSGAWTLAQAKAAWAASKARGPADLQQFAAAMTAVRDSASATACRSVTVDTADTELAEKGRQCDARDRALATVGSTGAVVNSQWAAHLAMMATKAHTDSAAYQDRWTRMVADAQAPLKRYAVAAAALARAPACSA